MDGAEFKIALKRLGRTQVGFAEETGTPLRTVHNWAAWGPPAEVIYLLQLMGRMQKPFDWPATEIETDAFDLNVDRELNRLNDAVGGERREAFLRNLERWLRTQRASVAEPLEGRPE